MATNLPSRMEQAAPEPCITGTCALCGTVWQARTDAATRGHKAGECQHAFESYRCGSVICDACLAHGGAYRCEGCGRVTCKGHSFEYEDTVDGKLITERFCFSCLIDTAVVGAWIRKDVEVVAA